jgi:hypothetical protein
MFGCQEVGPGRGGDGVRGFTSSFNSTIYGLSGTKPVALKLDLKFSDEKTRSCTVLQVSKDVFLSMWLMWLFAKT